MNDSIHLNWENCAVPDCPHKCCLRLKSSFCWCHTVGQPLNCFDGMTPEEAKAFGARVERENITRKLV